MSDFAQELLTIDRQRLDIRAGVLGLAVVTVFGAAVVVAGPEAMAAAIGALVVLASDPPPPGRSWALAILPLVVGGTALTYVAVSIGDHAVAAAVFVAAVGAAGSLQAGRSRKAGIRALVATIWIIVALTLDATGVSALTYSLAFALGASVASVLALARARLGAAEGVDDDDVDPGTTPPSGTAELLGSPLGKFAVIRSLGLAVAVLLGFAFFPEHPAWIAITSLLVMRPPTRQALVVGLQRSLGTGLGVLVAVGLASVVGENEPALIVLFLASAFFMMAVREVNYALFAALVTALVVYLQRILGADAAESGSDRFVETLVGVAIAFVVLGITKALTRTRITEA
jgi:hypothetical protein